MQKAGKHADDCVDIVKSLDYIGKHLGKVTIEFKHDEWHVKTNVVGKETHVTSQDLSTALRILSGREGLDDRS
jgi:hypothetical protein